MLIQFELRQAKLARRPVLSAPVLDRRHFPGRGVLYSLLVHEIIFCGLLAFQLFGAVENPPRLVNLGTLYLHNPQDVLYFPGFSHDVVKPESPAQTPRPPAPGRKGLTYPGPQEVVSNFEDPTNFIQTVLQPAIKNPAVLKPPLLLPNILQLPDPAPIKTVAPVLPDPVVKPPQPILPTKSAAAAAVEPPKLVIPEIKPSTALPKALTPLLALTPMPASPVQPPVIPAGEARGNFAISPEANVVAAGKNSPGGSEKAGVNSDAAVKPASAGISVTGGSSPNTAPSPAPSPAADPFAGITILGGSASSGNKPNSSPPPPGIVSIGSTRSVESSYGGITVISTASSGGGLPHSEVFSNEAIYTVYFDMNKAPNDGAPSWIFEFGVSPQNDRSKSAAQIQQGIILPFPTAKAQPAFPAESMRKYLRQRVIVYGVIQTDGKMQQISIKETPDIALNEAVVTALQKWVFRPAQVDGASVPVKVLLGVPVYQ